MFSEFNYFLDKSNQTEKWKNRERSYRNSLSEDWWGDVWAWVKTEETKEGNRWGCAEQRQFKEIGPSETNLSLSVDLLEKTGDFIPKVWNWPTHCHYYKLRGRDQI